MCIESHFPHLKPNLTMFKRSIIKQLEQKQSGHSMARTEELTHILNRIDRTLNIMNGGAHDYNNIRE